MQVVRLLWMDRRLVEVKKVVMCLSYFLHMIILSNSTSTCLGIDQKMGTNLR
jgi:hypothetical protein